MSSNLSVSYAGPALPTPSSGIAAATSAPAADGPLGFLAALLDQVLAHDAAPPAGDIASPPPMVLASVTGAAPEQPLANLLADLESQLGDLAQQLSSGASPTDGQLDALQQSLARIAQSLDDSGLASLPPLAGQLTELGRHLSEIGESLLGTAPAFAQQLSDLAARLADLGAANEAETADERFIGALLHLLLNGDNAGPADTSSPDDATTRARDLLASLDIAPAGAAPAATPATASVSPDLLRLSDQLSKIAAALAATSPELSRKLETLATALVATDADPELLTQLRAATASPDAATLDRLLAGLAAGKSAPAPTAPQMAGPASLKVPDSLMAPATAPTTPPPPAPRLAITELAAPDSANAPLDAEAGPAPAAQDAPKVEPPPAQPQSTALPPSHPSAARALPAAYQAPANPINMGHVAFEMARQVQQGASRFTIRLDPPELGRVDVKLHLDSAGGVNAHLTVDRVETLDLFQRDQRSLERALAQAGLDASRTSLEFSLRQNDNSSGGQRQPEPHAQAPADRPDDLSPAVPAVTLYRGTASAGGVNIFV